MNRGVKFVLILASLAIVSCSDDDTPTGVENPTQYVFEREGASTISFGGQTVRIGMATELVSAMKDFDKSESALVEMYANQDSEGGDVDPFTDATLNASSKSIRSKVAASADFFSANTAESAIIREQIGSWISSQATEVFVNKDELAEAGKAGQIADGTTVRYVSAQGIEYNQAVAKSLIGALMVDQMCNNYLSTSVLDAGDNRANNDAEVVEEGSSYTTMEHKWDEGYGYIFGASLDASDPLATLGDDSFLNKYLSSVDSDPDFAGIASDVFEAFKLGRAAIVAGDYGVRDEQAEIIKEKIAQVVAVRAVHYLQAGKDALAIGNNGGAFHDLSEGFGFVYSLRFARKANSDSPYFSRSEVDEFVTQLTSDHGFWDLNASTLDSISEAIAAKFNFTVAQAAD